MAFSTELLLRELVALAEGNLGAADCDVIGREIAAL